MMTGRPVVAASLIGLLDRSSPEALHRQLYGRLREEVLSGRLAAGTRLPSTRALAAELGVSRNTMTGAFLPLLSEGYLEGRVGSGTYVSRFLPEHLLHAGPGNGREGDRRIGGAEGEEPEDARRGRSHPRGLSGRGKLLAATSTTTVADRGRPRAFRPGVPALDAFPHREWKRLVARR
jgi:GntR family transcriptional regulator/MocR family aminotransferase